MKLFEGVQFEHERDLIADRELPDNPKVGPIKIFSWETALIKKVDPEKLEDVEMLKNIDAQPDVEKYISGPDLTLEDLQEENFFGVCLEKPKGKIGGFIWLYTSEDDTYDNLRERNLINTSENKDFLELSFARLVDQNLPIEEQVSGLIPSALRQICFSLCRKQREKEIEIMAFQHPTNLLSEGILINSGFVLKGKSPYHQGDKEENNFWILDEDRLEEILKKKRNNYAKKLKKDSK